MIARGRVRGLFDLEDEQLWGEGRNVEVERLGCTPRVLYQRFSDACRELDSQVWLRPWKREIERRVDAGERVVCTDVRTPEELEVVRALGGEVWRICWPGARAPGEAGMHATERVLAELPNRAFDRVIENDGGLEELRAKVEAALGE